MIAKQRTRLRYQILKFLHENSTQNYSAAVLKTRLTGAATEREIQLQLKLLFEDRLVYQNESYSKPANADGTEGQKVRFYIYRISPAGSMLLEDRSDKRINRYLSFGGFAVSLVALWFSYKANNPDKLVPEATPVHQDSTKIILKRSARDSLPKITPSVVASDSIAMDAAAD